jgi:hypothetical protein
MPLQCHYHCNNFQIISFLLPAVKDWPEDGGHWLLKNLSALLLTKPVFSGITYLSD